MQQENSESRFSSAVERIVATAEQAQDETSIALTESDLQTLSQLCALQSSNSNKGLAVNDNNLGFADVDVDFVCQLVGHLEKHVVAASSLDILALATRASAKLRSTNKKTMDQWIAQEKELSLKSLTLGIEAACILLFLISTPGIDRRVANEEAMEACIVLLRNHLSKHVLPSINQVGHITSISSSSSSSTNIVDTQSTPKKRRRSSGNTDANLLIKDLKKVYPQVLNSIPKTILLMEHMDLVVKKIPLDDQELLLIASGALVTLELDTPTTTQQIQPLHIASLSLIQTMVRRYPRLRSILIEDLFPLLPKLPTWKRTMRSWPLSFTNTVLYPPNVESLANSMVPANQEPKYIQTISVLVMTIVQASVERPQPLAPEQSITTTTTNGLRPCQVVAELFITHLLQRCSKKGQDGGASEYRPILVNFIQDWLLCLLRVEYPAAETLLFTLVNKISQILLSHSHHETTFLNTMFDALGKICAAQAKILKCARQQPVLLQIDKHSQDEKHVGCYCTEGWVDAKLMLNCDYCYSWYHGDCVGLVNKETVPEEWHCDTCQLDRIVTFLKEQTANMGGNPACVTQEYTMQRLLVDYLGIQVQKTGHSELQDAYEFHLARWLVNLNTTDNKNGVEHLGTRLLELWDPNEATYTPPSANTKSLSGMLHCLSEEGRGRMMVHLATNSSMLLKSFKRQIDLLVKFMAHDTSALLRKLSLKAIERVTDSDPQIMIYSFMKRAVTNRFSDEAISVREAVVSLVGAYVVQSPAVANAFHAAFMVGLNDSGVSVRKRTIHILKDILLTNPKYKGRAEACSEMLRLAADPKQDDGVRDLIHAVFLKVWLDHGDQTVAILDDLNSPSSTMTPKTPSTAHSRKSGVDTATKTPATSSTSASTTEITPLTSETRSTDRRTKKKRLQIRSEIAAEQMVQVVKAANTGETLTILLRELLLSAQDNAKQKAKSKKRRSVTLAQDHCSMLVDSLIEILLSLEENRMQLSEPGKELVAIMRTLQVFTEVSSISVVPHLDTLLPYLKADNAVSLQEEAIIVSCLSDVVSKLTLVLDSEEVERLGSGSLPYDLVQVTYKLGRDALASASEALCCLSSSPDEEFGKALLKLANTFYKVLRKYSGVSDFSCSKSKIKANVHRALSVLGSICRYHDTVLLEDDDEDEEELQSSLIWDNLTQQCKQIFCLYLEKKDAPTKCAALRAMCGVFIKHPRILLEMNQMGIIDQVMAPKAPPSLQLEALLCWREILLAEEARVDSGQAKAKMDSEKNITLSKKIAGDQDADATLFGGVLTSHAPRLFEMTQSLDKTLRYASLDLIGHLLRQGQVNPNEAVPFLLALQGDVEEEDIRKLALKFLMIEGEKRPDMLRQRVCAGVKQAYMFQQAVYPNLKQVSALVKVKTRNSKESTECVFGSVFKECIRSIKKQRHGLFRNFLGLFDLQNRKDQIMRANGRKSLSSSDTTAANFSLSDLPMLSFTSQVLAYLPYSAASDPLYIIHNISSTLALRGPDLLDRLANFLRPYGLASSDEMDEPNTEEDDLEKAAKRNIPHHDKRLTRLMEPDFDLEQFGELSCECGALTLLLRLKLFLRKAYNLSEARCLSFSPDEKERVTERAVSKISSMAVFDSKLAWGDDFNSMVFLYSEFRQLMRDETSSMELDDDDDDDDDYGQEQGDKSATKSGDKRKRSASSSEESEENCEG